ncbi:MAG: hybrid sensor histidine kinase/response regulator [Pseudomonadota bacterium]|nr:hybrid sensor histidine kinase/response regulator [Pseudomonadota bacterium]
MLQILKAVFEDEPYRLTLCSSGRDAMRVIAEDHVDLLLTDKNLPDIGGMELLRAAKQKDVLTEVVIITGYGSLETALTALEFDAFDYVLKPLNNVFDIRKKVRQAFQKQEIALENRRLIAELQKKNAELEEALEETRGLQAELIQSEKLAGIGTLAAGIAHEISSPLFGIMGLAEAVVDEQDLALAQGYARDVVEYCRTIRDIVVELSSYSRVATSEYLTTVELSRVVLDALRLVERSAPVSEVRFETDLGAGLYLNARTNEIQQVFVNLVKNAAEAVLERHPGGGGIVRIASGYGDGWTWATVSDNGPGIPEDKRRLIFDPFYTTKPPGKGTGLGLNIVYRIVTKYRGSIQVQSAVGEGTTFELRFPVDR